MSRCFANWKAYTKESSTFRVLKRMWCPSRGLLYLASLKKTGCSQDRVGREHNSCSVTIFGHAHARVCSSPYTRRLHVIPVLLYRGKILILSYVRKFSNFKFMNFRNFRSYKVDFIISSSLT